MKYFVLGFPENKESNFFFFFFFIFGTNQFIEFFWFFCIALQQLTKFFDRILVLGFWEQKYLKIGHDLKFLKFYGESNILHEFRPAWKLEIALHIFGGGQWFIINFKFFLVLNWLILLNSPSNYKNWLWKIFWKEVFSWLNEKALAISIMDLMSCFTYFLFQWR